MAKKRNEEEQIQFTLEQIDQLQSDLFATREMILNDFYFACRYFFMLFQISSMTDPDSIMPWQHNWHHEYICDFMTNLKNGDIKNLIINIPPSHSKTLIVIIFFIVWGFCHNPKSSFIHASYDQGKAEENSKYIKRIINARFDPFKYKDKCYLFDMSYLFPEITIFKRIVGDRHWNNISQGRMYSVSTGGAITGFHAGLSNEWDKGNNKYTFSGGIAIDDPHKLQDIHSENARHRVNIEWYEDTVKESRKSTEHTPTWIIMQRAHMDDLTGHILNETQDERFHRLIIPGVLKGSVLKNIKYLNDKEKSIIKRDKEYALWPLKKDIDSYLNMRVKNPSLFYGQYQQEPGISGGNMFKIESIKRHSELPRRDFGYFVIDSAMKANKNNDYTVVQYWIKANNQLYLVDQLRFKKEQPSILVEIINFYSRYKPNLIFIEDKASGTGIIQFLQLKKLPVIEFNPNKYGNKVDRAELACLNLEYLGVSIPKEAIWIDEFMKELQYFPKATNDDKVDAFVMGIICGDANINLHDGFSNEHNVVEDIPTINHLFNKVFISFCFDSGKSCVIGVINNKTGFINIIESIVYDEDDDNINNESFIRSIRERIYPEYKREDKESTIIYVTDSAHTTIRVKDVDYDLSYENENTIKKIFNIYPIKVNTQVYIGQQLESTVIKANTLLKKFEQVDHKLVPYLSINKDCEYLIDSLSGSVVLSTESRLDKSTTWKLNYTKNYISILFAFYTLITNINDHKLKDNKNSIRNRLR